MGLFGNLFGGSDVKKFRKKLASFEKEQVGSHMTEDVMTVTPDETLVNAANIMIGEHISCLIVVEFESKEPQGIITERDFLRQPPEKTEELKKKKVEDLMTTEVVTAQPSLTLLDASEIMNEHKFRKLVVTKDGKLSGILTQTDLVNAMDDVYQDFTFHTSDSLTVKSIKKECVKVETKDKVKEAHDKMMEENTGSIFVVEDDSVVGTFTEFDFLSQLAMNPEEIGEMEMGDVMSFPVVGIDKDIDLFDANHLMLEKGFRRLPILTGGELNGKVTQTVVREKGYELLTKSLQRSRKGELEKVSFNRLKEPNHLVRDIEGKVQKYVYA